MKLQDDPDGDICCVAFSNALREETRDITEQALGECDNQDRLVAVTLSEVSPYIDVEALPAQLGGAAGECRRRGPSACQEGGREPCAMW